MSELPRNWVSMPLAKAGLWGSGGTPRRSNPAYFEGGSIPWLVIGDLNDGVVYRASTFITEAGLANSSAKLLSPGTLLVAMYGSIGKLGVTGMTCATNQAIASCKPHSDVIQLKYLFYALMAEKKALFDQGQGGAQQNISQGILKKHSIHVAPLNEQRRITDKLDAALTRVDVCRDHLDRVPAILKRFRQSVLATAISGALTEEWRDARHVGDDWVDCDVQAIAQVGTGSTPLRSNPNFFASTGMPWVTSAATSQPVVLTAHEYVTDAAIAAHRLKIFPIGTLLVAMYGEGKTRGQITELGIEATVNQACAAVVVDTTRAMTSFVKLFLQANYFEMRELAEGGNQPNLNLSKVKAFPLRLPSIEEQAEIVRRVESLFAWADRLEARHTAARAQIERLTPALLAKAFRGELVPQDPADEPASDLLERLAQRAANRPTGSSKRRAARAGRANAVPASSSA